MPCQPFQSRDDKITGIICRRSRRGGKCRSCGAPSAYECDFPASKASGTCDTKICARCSLHFGWRWETDGVNLQDSYDFCPTHAPFVFAHEQRLIFVASHRGGQAGEMIDRTTPLGNPYRLDGADGDTPEARAAVLEQYRQWLWREMQNSNSRAKQDLDQLKAIWLENGTLTLLCWCTPKPCHGQIVARALCWLAQQESENTK